MTATESFRNSRVAQLIAVMATSFLIGAYAVLIGLVVWTLVVNHHSMPVIHKALFWASIVMFCLCVASLGLVIQELSIDNPSTVNRKVQIGLGMLQYTIGDLILVWRVWVIWGYSYLMIAAPLAIMIVGTGFGLNLLFGRQDFYTIVPAVLVAANTSLCTILIAGKIWYMQHQLSRETSSVTNQYTRTLLLVVESGALYTSVLVVSLSLLLKNSDVTNAVLPIMLDLEIPLTGILPTLIIVVVHFGLVSQPTTRAKSWTHSLKWSS